MTICNTLAECQIKKEECNPLTMRSSTGTDTMLRHMLSSHEEDYNKLIIKSSCDPHFDTQFNDKEQCITTCKLCSSFIELKSIVEHFTNEHLDKFRKEKENFFILRIINIDYYFCILCDLIVYIQWNPTFFRFSGRVGF